jgi:hypothetical protein
MAKQPNRLRVMLWGLIGEGPLGIAAVVVIVIAILYAR